MFLISLFRPKPKNPIYDLERQIASESERILTRKELKDFSFNHENHLCYIIAELIFILETNPVFKDFCVNDELQTFINEIKQKQSFSLMYSEILNFSKSIPNRDKALWNLTSVYFLQVWDAPDVIVSKIINLKVYSVYLARIRDSTSRLIEGFLINLIT